MAGTDVSGCPQFAEGFVSSDPIVFNQSDPQPIAIRFKTGGHGGKTVRYIVSCVD